MSAPAVTVIGNLAIDRIDDAAPTPGGCPSFIGDALLPVKDHARLLCSAAKRDIPFFQPLLDRIPVPYHLFPAATTASFSLRYHGGEDRVMEVDDHGLTWQPQHVADIRGWVHVSGLLRTDFPAETLRALHEHGCKVSFDGQGLIRRPQRGPLRTDREFDADTLRRLTVLKLAREEAEVILGDTIDVAAVSALGVPEVLVTHGSRGCDLYTATSQRHIPAAHVVTGVHTTGAGDMFTVAYVVARSQGHEPSSAATHASAFVAQQLDLRAAR